MLGIVRSRPSARHGLCPTASFKAVMSLSLEFASSHGNMNRSAKALATDVVMGTEEQQFKVKDTIK